MIFLGRRRSSAALPLPISPGFRVGAEDALGRQVPGDSHVACRSLLSVAAGRVSSITSKGRGVDPFSASRFIFGTRVTRPSGRPSERKQFQPAASGFSFNARPCQQSRGLDITTSPYTRRAVLLQSQRGRAFLFL